jgi:hypothetical protein
MSNKTNEEWAEQQYQIQLDKLAGEEKEVIKLQDTDPDDHRDNLEDR